MKLTYKIGVFLVSDVLTLLCSIIAACYLAGYPTSWLRTHGVIYFPPLLCLQLFTFMRLGLYRAISRYAGIDVLLTVLKALSLASLISTVGFYVSGVKIPLQVMVINWLLTVFGIGGSRFFVRYYYELRQRYRSGRRVLIYGAGDMGTLMLRQIKMNKIFKSSPVGFLDDASSKQGSIIQGLKVLGKLADLESIIDQYRIEDVIVAIAELPSEELRRVVKICRSKSIVCRIIPCFSKLLEAVPNLRNIELADLIRRSPRDLDMNQIQQYLYNQTVLVTGAAGSIGSELVRQCLKFSPQKVIAFDQSEYGLYALREDLGDEVVQYVLGDATIRGVVENIFKRENPSIVFHAAAYKHVPLLESNPLEAVRNNVQATKMLAEAAHRYGAKSFVLISTDKAVKPSNIMGATKRICELIVQNFDRISQTEYVAVRFGNVLGSSGSVIPKFLKQIQMGGPVTVTHPEATRYFMLTEEAVQLVLQAAALGRGGEIFLLNMGKPVKIFELAEDLIFLTGRQPHHDVQIHFTGLRPGEKIHEELLHAGVEEEKTRFTDITIGKPTAFDYALFESHLNRLLDFPPSNTQDLLTLIKQIIPETTWGTAPVQDDAEDFPLQQLQAGAGTGHFFG